MPSVPITQTLGPSIDELGVYIVDASQEAAFQSRPLRPRDHLRDIAALKDLVAHIASPKEELLQALVDVARGLSGADGTGISLEEGELFRWIATSGSFHSYVNGTTPRNLSPCGICVNRDQPQYYRVDQPYLDFLGAPEVPPITDGLLLPWHDVDARGTLWLVSQDPAKNFDAQDLLYGQTLAEFTAVALKHQRAEEALRHEQVLEAELRLKDAIAHEINNPLQGATNAIYLGRVKPDSSAEFLAQAEHELKRISKLLRGFWSTP